MDELINQLAGTVDQSATWRANQTCLQSSLHEWYSVISIKLNWVQTCALFFRDLWHNCNSHASAQWMEPLMCILHFSSQLQGKVQFSRPFRNEGTLSRVACILQSINSTSIENCSKTISFVRKIQIIWSSQVLHPLINQPAFYIHS